MRSSELTSHETYMMHCLALAREARGNGKTAVGSIVVRNGEVIAEGIEGDMNFPAVLAHAEVIAVAKATERLGTKDLSGCILYTTVEPCLMCSFVIRETKIGHIVYGIGAGSIGGHASKYPILTTSDMERWGDVPEVTSGILAGECGALLKGK